MVCQKSVRVQISSYGRSALFPSPSVGQFAAFEDFRCLNSYPLDQVGSGNSFRGKIYDWLKKGILLMWINFLYSRPEALHGASCTKTHFIHCLGSSRQANIRSKATLLQPCVCFLNEIVNRETSESCYITLLLLYIVYCVCCDLLWFVLLIVFQPYQNSNTWSFLSLFETLFFLWSYALFTTTLVCVLFSLQNWSQDVCISSSILGLM